MRKNQAKDEALSRTGGGRVATALHQTSKERCQSFVLGFCIRSRNGGRLLLWCAVRLSILYDYCDSAVNVLDFLVKGRHVYLKTLQHIIGIDLNAPHVELHWTDMLVNAACFIM